MNPSDETKGMIGIGTALILFAVLVALAFTTLKGTALILALLIVLALAVKALLHHLRRRISG